MEIKTNGRWLPHFESGHVHTYTAKEGKSKREILRGTSEEKEGKIRTHSGGETKAKTKQAHIQSIFFGSFKSLYFLSSTFYYQKY